MSGLQKPGYSRWWLGAKVAASAAIVSLLVWQAWSSGQFQLLWTGEKNWPFLLLALFASTAAHFVGFFRWYWMGHAVGLPISMFESLRIGLIGNLFSLITVGVVGGDGLRAWYAARKSPGRRAEAVASVFLDRAIGMFTMFLVAAFGYWWCRALFQSSPDVRALQAIRWMCWFSAAVAIAGMAGIAVMIQLTRYRKSAWYRRIGSGRLFGPFFQRLTGIFMLYRSRQDALIGCVVLSLLVNVFFAIAIWSVARFLPGDHPGLDLHLMIAPISMVANCLPLPGGIGGMEAALGFLYRGLMPAGNASASPEVVVAFVFRLTLLFVALQGVVAWFLTSRSLREEMQHANQP